MFPTCKHVLIENIMVLINNVALDYLANIIGIICVYRDYCGMFFILLCALLSDQVQHNL